MKKDVWAEVDYHSVPTKDDCVLKEAKGTQGINFRGYSNVNMASNFSTPQSNAIKDEKSVSVKCIRKGWCVRGALSQEFINSEYGLVDSWLVWNTSSSGFIDWYGECLTEQIYLWCLLDDE